MMDVRQREKWKTGLLIGLVLISLVQVGIHWYRQVQGRPLHLLSAFIKGDSQELVDERLLSLRKTSYITPLRLSASDEGSFRWMLAPGEDAWNDAWTDIRQHYLPRLVTEKPDKTQPRSAWEQLLASRRLVLVEFASPIPAELLPWLSSAQGVRKGYPADTFSQVEQIAIVPSENVNATVNTLYVLSKDNVYRFTLGIPDGALPKSRYVMSQETLDVGNNRQMALIAGKYGLNSVSSDLLVVDDEIPLSLARYDVFLPPAIPEVFTPDNLQPLQESILLSRKDSLLTRIDEATGDVFFSDIENSFRVTTKGRFTYRYMPGSEPQTADGAAAFRQVVAFLDERRRLLGDTELVLVEVAAPANGSDVFAFSFAYRVDGQLLYATREDNPTGAAVTVAATGSRVMSCDWLIRRVSPVSTGNWSVFFYDLYNEAVQLYPELLTGTSQIRHIHTGYRFPADLLESELAPVWFLETADGIRVLPMKAEGG
jgi:hypothetical protein